MKKVFSVFLVIAMAFSLTACGSGADTETKETTAAAVETGSAETTITGTVSAVDGETVTVTTEAGEETTFTVNDATVYTMDMGDMTFGEDFDPTQTPDNNADFDPSQMQGGSGEMPEMPEGFDPSQMQGGSGEMPEMPEGFDPTQMQGGSGEMPDMPEGFDPTQMQGGSGEMPEMSEGFDPSQMQGGRMPGNGQSMEPGLSMITVGTTVTVTLSDGVATEVRLKMNGSFGGGQPGGMGGDADIEYTAANIFSETTSLNGESYTSTGKDENAVLVTDGEVALNDVTVERTSSDSTGGDNASFYGVGAAVLTTGGTVCVNGGTISTDASGGTGVFAYGDGTAYVSDTVISTRKDTSGGVHVAGGGTLYAWDLQVETEGASSAAIRSDRGSGTMVIDGGSCTSRGSGSPAIYSTADITVNNAALTAEGSEAICIEGKNSIRLYDCDLSGNMSDDSRNDCTWNVILYQSMSGDAAEGNSLFEMVGGTLTARNGGMFYTTNTQSTFVLSGVDIQNAADSEFLLKCTGNGNQRGWGKSGSNGAQCTFTAIGQTLPGDVIWDSISTLDMYLTQGSILTGAFVQDETNTGDGYAMLTIDDGSTWVVTADSTLTTLALAGSIVDEAGQIVNVVGTDGTVYVRGTSALTVTVESFSGTADLAGCSAAGSFADYAVDRK